MTKEKQLNMAEELHRMGGVKALREWNKAVNTLVVLSFYVRTQHWHSAKRAEADKLVNAVCKLPQVIEKKARWK